MDHYLVFEVAPYLFLFVFFFSSIKRMEVEGASTFILLKNQV